MKKSMFSIFSKKREFLKVKFLNNRPLLYKYLIKTIFIFFAIVAISLCFTAGALAQAGAGQTWVAPDVETAGEFFKDDEGRVFFKATQPSSDNSKQEVAGFFPVYFDNSGQATISTTQYTNQEDIERLSVKISPIASPDGTYSGLTPLLSDPTQPVTIGNQTLRYVPDKSMYYLTTRDPVTNSSVGIWLDPTSSKIKEFGKASSVQKAELAANQDVKNIPNHHNGQCLYDFGIDIGNCIDQALYFILFFLSMLVGLAGSILNTVVQYTLVDMKTNIDAIRAIDSGWAAIRDLVNISFIFILLYISIQTILGIGEHDTKHVLVKLILIAMLVNFSMFFTKVVIDASNMLAFEFYNKIQTGQGYKGSPGGFGDAVMNAFRLQTVYNETSTDVDSNARAFARGNNPGTVFIMGIIFIITALGVILGGSFIFIHRFVILIFLMIFAPLGFAGMILHSTQGYAREWWSKLMTESFAAPVFMIMMWLVFDIINNSSFKLSIGLTDYSSLNQNVNAIMAGTTSSSTQGGVIMNFVIVSVLFYAVLIACQKIGASGADSAIKVAGGVKNAAGTLGGWAGKNTIGAAAYNVLEKTDFGMKTLKQLRQHSWAPVRVLGRGVVGGLQKLGAGHAEDVHNDEAALKDTLHELRDDPAEQAKFLTKMFAGKKGLGGLAYPYNQKVAKYLTSEMKEEDLATISKFMEAQGDDGKKASAEMLGYLGKEKQKAVQEIMDNKVTRFDKIKVGDEAELLKREQELARTRAEQVLDPTKHRTVTFYDDHGNKRVLEDADADAHVASLDLAGARTRLKQQFDSFSEKQKTEIMGTLSQEEQKALAGDDEFMKMISTQIKDYRTLENTMKGGMAKELQERLASVAYDGLSRAKIATLFHSPHWASLSGTEQTNLLTHFNSLSPGVTMADYVASNKYRDDQTFWKADRNFTRISAANQGYADLSGVLSAHSIDLKAPII